MTIHQDIDKLFKQGLEDYSEKPPSFVWGNVEQSLNKSRLKRRRNILYSIAASVAIVLSFGSGYLLTGPQSNNLIADNNTNTTNNIEIVDTKATLPIELSDNTVSITSTNVSNNKQPDNTKKTNKVKKQKTKKTQQKKATKTKSSIKKVRSSGKLLPPMFASSSTLTTKEDKGAEQNELLSELQPKEAYLIKEDNENDISFMENNKKRHPSYTNYQTSDAPIYSFNDKPSDNSTLWSVGMSATPLMSFRNVSNTSSEAINPTDINTNYEQEYNNEKPLTSYSVGVNVGYKVASRWKIQSGVYMSELGQVSENVTLTEQPIYALNDDNISYNINTSAGNINIQGSPNDLINQFSDNKIIEEDTNHPKPSAPGSSDIKAELSANFVQTFEYIEIPVLINYTVIDRKLAMNISGGLSTNFMYNNNSYIENDGSFHDLSAETQDLKTMNYSGIVGLGFEYPIITKLKINLQPTFRYSLNPIDNTGTAYPYSFGVYTGLKYNF